MSLTLMLTYPFMQRALIAGTLVSLCAALLGVPLVLKRYSMIGDGLSHVSFGALAIAVALGFTPLYFSIPVVILAAFFLLRLATNPRWNSDAAIAVMSASALAVGIIVISRTSGMTTDVDNYMFGSVLAMTWADVALSAVLSLAVLALFVLFVILYMAGIGQWLCIAFGVTSASALVWLTFHLNGKFGEHGLMKLLAKKQHPRYLINRISPRKLFTIKKKNVCGTH